MDMKNAKANTNTEAIHASYDYRVQIGDTVTFVAITATKLSDGNRLVIGDTYTGTVTIRGNGGFRGLEMGVKLEDGRKLYGHTTGTITSWVPFQP